MADRSGAPSNPLVAGPAWTPNHIQSDTATKITSATVIPVVHGEILGTTRVPPPLFVQPNPPPKANHAAFPLGDGKG